MTRPAPAWVLDLPTVTVRFSKSIWLQRRVRISFFRSAVFRASVTTALSSAFEPQALSSFFSSSRVRALPTLLCSRSNFTSHVALEVRPQLVALQYLAEDL
jgi:hypothetical protein